MGTQGSECLGCELWSRALWWPVVGTLGAGSSTQDEHSGHPSRPGRSSEQGRGGGGSGALWARPHPHPSRCRPGPCPGRTQSCGSSAVSPRSRPAQGRESGWVTAPSAPGLPGTLGCYLVASIFGAGRLVVSGPAQGLGAGWAWPEGLSHCPPPPAPTSKPEPARAGAPLRRGCSSSPGKMEAYFAPGRLSGPVGSRGWLWVSLKESCPSPSAPGSAVRRAFGHGWAGSSWAPPSACPCSWEAGRAGAGRQGPESVHI